MEMCSRILLPKSKSLLCFSKFHNKTQQTYDFCGYLIEILNYPLKDKIIDTLTSIAEFFVYMRMFESTLTQN